MYIYIYEADSRTVIYLKDPNGYSKAARSAALLYPLGSTRAYARGARGPAVCVPLIILGSASVAVAQWFRMRLRCVVGRVASSVVRFPVAADYIRYARNLRWDF